MAMTRRVLAALVLWSTAWSTACTWFDEGPPGRTCKADRDCFRAQGEFCNQTSHTCDAVDAGPVVDATVTVVTP
jgi:hypothetical protein